MGRSHLGDASTVEEPRGKKKKKTENEGDKLCRSRENLTEAALDTLRDRGGRLSVRKTWGLEKGGDGARSNPGE